MIEDTMLEAANTMKAAADEIERLREEHDMLAQALRGLLNTRPTYSLEYGRAEDAARAALAKLERPS